MNPAEMKSYDYYAELIPVDRRHLSDELVGHVEHTADVMRRATFLRHDVDVKKQALAKTEAAASIRYRSEPGPDGKKRTVDDVKNHVTIDPEVTAAYADYLKAKEEAEKWSTLSDAFRHRGYAMRELTELLTIEMMSDPGTLANRRVERNFSRTKQND